MRKGGFWVINEENGKDQIAGKHRVQFILEIINF